MQVNGMDYWWKRAKATEENLKWALEHLDLNMIQDDWDKALALLIEHKVKHDQVNWNHPDYKDAFK